MSKVVSTSSADIDSTLKDNILLARRQTVGTENLSNISTQLDNNGIIDQRSGRSVCRTEEIIEKHDDDQNR